MVYQVSHYIDGRSYQEISANKHILFNPATGDPIGEFYYASPALCDLTVEKAKKAFEPWASTTLTKRTKILFKFRDLLEKYQMDIAKLVLGIDVVVATVQIAVMFDCQGATTVRRIDAQASASPHPRGQCLVEIANEHSPYVTAHPLFEHVDQEPPKLSWTNAPIAEERVALGVLRRGSIA